jgi:hypothetical protein
MTADESWRATDKKRRKRRRQLCEGKQQGSKGKKMSKEIGRTRSVVKRREKGERDERERKKKEREQRKETKE